MANVTNLSTGSKGEDVKKLQAALIDAGYNVGSTGADGVFGKNTQAAVKQYQKDNGLVVDGIAGKNTQGSLYGTNKGGTKKPEDTQPTTPTETAPTVTPDGTKPIAYGNLTDEGAAAYQNIISQAWDTLEQMKANKPGEYQYGADYDIANNYLNQYQNRDPFSYDFNSDALYNQYKEQYIQQGRLGMMDTMGQAAAMTGGYGSSYGQSVGQQTYNQYLNQLNDIIPELNQMAYDRYQQEGQDLLNMYNLYMNRENDNYSKYLDSVDMWNQDVANARNDYNTLYNEYVGAYDQKYAEDQTDKEWEYKKEQDDKEWEYKESQAAKDEQNTKYNRLANLISSTGYSPSAAELKAAGMTEAEAKSLKDAYTSSISSTGGNGTGKTSGDTKYTTFDYEEQQKWDKEFQKAGTLADVERIADRMEHAGIDPKIVADWYENYAKKFEDKQTVKTPSWTNRTSYGGSGLGSPGYTHHTIMTQ